MTTALLKAVAASKLTENQAPDLLQEAGVISDLCLRLKDVAGADISKAIGVLRLHAYRRPKVKGISWVTQNWKIAFATPAWPSWTNTSWNFNCDDLP